MGGTPRRKSLRHSPGLHTVLPLDLIDSNLSSEFAATTNTTLFSAAGKMPVGVCDKERLTDHGRKLAGEPHVP